MDGVPAVTSCPIAPGDTFTYSFKADLYGTGWYHSHYSGQATGGLMGPVVIHGPSALDYDIDLGPVMVSEWYHKDYLELIDDGKRSITRSKSKGFFQVLTVCSRGNGSEPMGAPRRQQHDQR